MRPEPPAITSRAGFQTALRWGFAQAIAGGARQIVAVNRDFCDWPFEDLGLQAELAAWLRLPERRLVLLATSYDEIMRRQPRFVAWRALWSHAIRAGSPASSDAVDLPGLLVDDRDVSVHLIDPIHWRGRAALDARTAQSWRDRIDALLQRSETAFAVNQLGL